MWKPRQEAELWCQVTETGSRREQGDFRGNEREDTGEAGGLEGEEGHVWTSVQAIEPHSVF